MKHLDLFSGIGGFSLAAQALGIKTVQFVEINPYCCHVLQKHFPTIPIHRDIRTFHAKPNQFDLITGGSPCQDLSLAGKRTGISGNSSALWFEMLRVIEEAKPRFVIWENVKGAFYTGGLSEVLHGLCQLGYRFDVEILSAAAVGAPHLRERIFAVAYTRSLCGQAPSWADQIRSQIAAVANPDGIAGIRSGKGNQTVLAPWRGVEPPICGVAHGLPRRLDRLAALGNAVVPAVAAIALQRVLYLESHRHKSKLN
ncbi:DNA cytosine methyltransferase [Pseudanabaena sp. PCC 6802]|uniref:DNA cytosine methyltransferase n=1 Tax=Pseudanabaena sp. PCC 6802 TaxID=118173 RepID=UPI0003455A1E|nr:DNA cytosine methyltransferase [Pseudanabaena sp. PCC 6802]